MLDTFEHHAIIFKSIKNPDLYILGVHKDHKLTIEIPPDLRNRIYDLKDICLGSKLFKPISSQYWQYTLNIKWEAIVNSIKVFTLENNKLYLEGFEPEIKAYWGPNLCTDVISLSGKVNFKSLDPWTKDLINNIITHQIDALTLSDLNLLFNFLGRFAAKNNISLEDAKFLHICFARLKNKEGLVLFYKQALDLLDTKCLAHIYLSTNL
jgi:hypothetical protein